MDEVERVKLDRIVAAFILAMERQIPRFDSSFNSIVWGIDFNSRGKDSPVGIRVMFQREPGFQLPTEFEFEGETFEVSSNVVGEFRAC